MSNANLSNDDQHENHNGDSSSYRLADSEEKSAKAFNGKNKEARLLHNWLKFSKNRTVLTIKDIPKDVAPSCTKNAHTYAMRIARVSPWPLPSSLIKRSSKPNARALTYSVSMSFYHASSKQFFGSTWIGHDHPNTSVEEDGSLKINELIYFQSRISDRNCFAVLELVATEHDPQHKSSTGQFACGWALMKPFVGDILQTDLNDQQGKGEKICSLNVISGTPRKLLSMKRDAIDEINDKCIATIDVGISKIHLEPHLVQENEIVGASIPVAGLQTNCFTYHDERGMFDDACIGGQSVKNGTSWLLKPRVGPTLADTYRLRVNNAKVTIHRRLQYEDSLLQFVDKSYFEEVPNKKTNIFSRAKIIKNGFPFHGSRSGKGKIVQRALKFGVHNGHALRGNKWHVVELTEKSCDSDSLQSNEFVDIDRFVKHRLCALVSVLVYTVKLACATVKNSTTQVEKGVATGSNIVSVVAGCQVYLPYDGKILRLRNTQVEQNKVICTLLNGSSCQIFTDSHVFTPDKSTTERLGTIDFSLQCYDEISCQELCDESPPNDSDRSFSDASENLPNIYDRGLTDENCGPETIIQTSNIREETRMISHEFVEQDSNDNDSEELESSMVSGDTFHNFLRIRADRLGQILESGSVDPQIPILSDHDCDISSIREENTADENAVGIVTSNAPAPKPDSVISEEPEDDSLVEDIPDKNRSASCLEREGETKKADEFKRCSSNDNEQKMPDELGPIPSNGCSSSFNDGSLSVRERGNSCDGNDIHRATRTRLQRCGIDVTTESDEHQNDSTRHELQTGMDIKKGIHNISIEFVAYAASKPNSTLPRIIFFTFKFYDKDSTETKPSILYNYGIPDEEDCTKPRVLIMEDKNCKDCTSNDNIPRNKPILLQYDVSSMLSHERESFVKFLETKKMFVDVWDAESRMHIGTFLVPLKLLIPKNSTTTQVSKDFDVICPHKIGDDRGEIMIHDGKLIAGSIVGSVSVRLKNQVKEGRMTSACEMHKQAEIAKAPHRVRARPLIDADDELKEIMNSVMGDSPYEQNTKPHTDHNEYLNGRDSQELTNLKNANKTRQHKLRSITTARKEMASNGDVPQCDSRSLFFDDLMHGYKGPFRDEYKRLEVVKWYRQSIKKDFIKRYLAQNVNKTISLHPFLGQLIFFEFEFTNPFNRSERFLIENDIPDLRVVTDSKEWNHLRQFVTPVVGTVGSFPVEHCMIDLDSKKTPQLVVEAHETVSIPFVFRRECSNAARSGCVKFIGATHVDTVSCLHIKVFPKDSPIIDRTFYLNALAGEVVKRSMKYFSNGQMSATNRLETEGSNISFVRCIDSTSSRSVFCEWKGVDEVDGYQHVDLICRCGEECPSKEEFFLFLFEDQYQAILKECWHFVVEVKAPLYETVSIGQLSQKDVSINGVTRARTVAFFCDNIKDNLTFDPSKPFQLVYGSQNRATFKFKFLHAGSHKVSIHLVDQDTKELVYAWMMRVTCQLPIISKEYDVDISKGQGSSKKLPFTNQWEEPKRFNLISSNEKYMIPKNSSIEIDGKKTEYIRLQLCSVYEVGTHEVYLFVNDDGDQVKECFLLRLQVKE